MCRRLDTNNCFIKGATSATYTPVAFDVTKTVVAVALYTDGHANGADAKDFAMMVTANSVLADTRNKAPVFGDQERMVGENVPVAFGSDTVTPVTPLVRNVGAVVTAMDFITANDGMQVEETLTYTLGGPDAASFTIDRASAQISTKADVPLDTETKDTYTVTVTATDPSGLTATVTVTIMVTGVDEAPEIMLGGLTISGMSNVDYAENDTDAVATYTAVGPESDSTDWSLSGDDAGDFNITAGGGVLTFRNSPDYESPADADTNNIYMVTVMANDGTYTDTHQVTVTVTDDGAVAPTILGPSNVDYAEDRTDAVATYMLSDATAASAAWTLDGPDDGDFDISSGGVLTFGSSPDYELPADANTDNIYMITVNASDGTDMDSLLVTIMVTDVDEGADIGAE